MKKRIILIGCLLGLLKLTNGQVYYNFVQDQETYVQLLNANAIQLTSLAGNPQFYQPTLARPIKAFGESTSPIITIGSGGFLISTSSQYSFAFDPFLAELIPQSGEVYLKWDTLTFSADHHLYVEWRDFQLMGNPASDFVNFRIDFNLTNEVIEFHYGDSQVTDTVAFYNGNTGPQAIIALLTPDFTGAFFYNTLKGDPTNPTHHSAPAAAYLSDVPPSGTVYRFVPVDISLKELEDVIEVYPNPVLEVMKLDGVDNGSIQAIGMDGKVVILEVVNGEVNMSSLASGNYVIHLTTEDSIVPKTFKITKR